MDQKVVFITGAAGGIGAATCRAFAEKGYAVAFNDFNEEGGEKLLSELESVGYRALFLHGDATDEARVSRMVRSAADAFGRVDVLVNNAGGLGGRSPFDGMETAFWRRVMALNLDSAFFAARACIPWLKKARGCMINLTSIAAYNGGGPGAGVYAAPKAAVLAMTKALAKELIPDGVRVNAVSPGTIDTAFHSATGRDIIEGWRKGIPAQRLGEPCEVADVICYLASPQASYLVGEVIQVNGGQMMI